MEKIDLRKVNNDELFTIRKQVVRLKQMALPGERIEEMTGVSQSAVSRIWSSYQKGGVKALRPQKSGRKTGTCMLLSDEQQQELKRSIIDKTPEQYKMSFMLWTREAISRLARLKFGVRLSLRSVTNYMKRWGFTCQRPTKKAYFVDNVKVDCFMKEEYPAIAKRAKEEDAEIYWGDETGIDNQTHYQRGYAPKGKTPTVRVEVKRERVNMMSAITNKGKIRFMMYEDNMNQDKLIGFLRRMADDVPCKVFLILDNLRVHHGKKVREWLEKHKERIEVFYLPAYSPELNPDEYFNHSLKKSVHSGMEPRTKKQIHHKAQSYVRRLQHHPDRVKAFFRHPKLTYQLCNC